MLQEELEFNYEMSMCVSKSLNMAFLMGGFTNNGLPKHDVYSWDLRNDRVTRRNHMPHHLCAMRIVV
jgi:hypothetical protein